MIGSNQSAAPKILQGYYAGFVSRTLAFTIDVVIIFFSVSIIGSFITIFFTFLEQNTILSNILGYLSILQPFLSDPRVFAVFVFLFVFIYNIFFWVFSGRTPGKSVMGLRVVPLKGGKMPYLRSFIRFFGYYISMFFLFFGFVWIIVDDRRQGWHDKLAGTCVIYTWEAQPDERFLASAIKKIKRREADRE